MKSLHPWKIALLFGLLSCYSVSAVPDPRHDDNLYRWLEGPQVLVWTIPGWEGRELELQYLRVELEGDKFTLEPLSGNGTFRGEGKIDRDKVTISFRLSGPVRYEYLHVADFEGLGYGGARGSLTFGKVSEGVPNVGHWAMRPLPSPEEFEKPAVGEKEEDAIDALLAEIGDPEASYEEMRARPDAEEGVPVRLHFIVYDRKEPIIVREDVARIEPALDEEKEPVDPSFVIAAVFANVQMEQLRPPLEKALGKPTYEEKARVIPGGALQHFFSEGPAPKGWGESFLRADVDEKGWSVAVDLAMKAAGVERVSGLTLEVWTGQWIVLTGPVSEGLYRNVFLRIESTEPPKEEDGE